MDGTALSVSAAELYAHAAQPLKAQALNPDTQFSLTLGGR
jgi:hypothetical protein